MLRIKDEYSNIQMFNLKKKHIFWFDLPTGRKEEPEFKYKSARTNDAGIQLHTYSDLRDFSKREDNRFQMEIYAGQKICKAFPPPKLL